MCCVRHVDLVVPRRPASCADLPSIPSAREGTWIAGAALAMSSVIDSYCGVPPIDASLPHARSSPHARRAVRGEGALIVDPAHPAEMEAGSCPGAGGAIACCS